MPAEKSRWIRDNTKDIRSGDAFIRPLSKTRGEL